jgi:hypothetical protein
MEFNESITILCFPAFKGYGFWCKVEGVKKMS